jgi:hypothetical protein
MCLTGGQMQGQIQGQQTVGLAFPDTTGGPGAALQRLEYIPVKMQLKQNTTEMLAVCFIYLFIYFNVI